MAETRAATPDYGNWVSRRLIVGPGIVGAVALVASLAWWPLSIVAAVLFATAAYFAWARRQFSASGGDVQARIRALLLERIEWDGTGRALDVGCGNGALAVELAREHPAAAVDGIDYWGANWEYSRDACAENARCAGVEARTAFQKASASSLPYPDATFDLVVSNLVFHEVADAHDKREVIKEALRVLKPGGSFAFQDLFLEKRLYGEVRTLLDTIGSWGVHRVAFFDSSAEPSIPRGLRLPFMVGRIGILYGRK